MTVAMVDVAVVEVVNTQLPWWGPIVATALAVVMVAVAVVVVEVVNTSAPPPAPPGDQKLPQLWLFLL